MYLPGSHRLFAQWESAAHRTSVHRSQRNDRCCYCHSHSLDPERVGPLDHDVPNEATVAPFDVIEFEKRLYTGASDDYTNRDDDDGAAAARPAAAA
jgi:hypothetical protein